MIVFVTIIPNGSFRVKTVRQVVFLKKYPGIYKNAGKKLETMSGHSSVLLNPFINSRNLIADSSAAFLFAFLCKYKNITAKITPMTRDIHASTSYVPASLPEIRWMSG